MPISQNPVVSTKTAGPKMQSGFFYALKKCGGPSAKNP